MRPIWDLKAPTELGRFSEKNIRNLAKKLAPSCFPGKKVNQVDPRKPILEGGKMVFS